MVEAQDEDEDQKYPEEMIRAFALLKASKAQFQAHPERIEFEGSNCVTGYLTLQSDTISDLQLKLRSKANSPIMTFGFRSDRQWRLQQLQDCGNHIEFASIVAQDGINYVRPALRSLRKGLDRIDCPLPLSLSALVSAQFSRMFVPSLPTDCLANLFIHSSSIVLSLYFCQPTTKQVHPPIKRLYYPQGTVFEVGAQRLEVYSANHVKAPIQWLRAARDNGKQAEEIMNLISCRSD